MLTTQSLGNCSRNKFTSQWGIVASSIQSQQPCQAHLLSPPHAPSFGSQSPSTFMTHSLGFLVLAASVPLPMPFLLLEGSSLPGKHLQRPVNHHFWSLPHLPESFPCQTEAALPFSDAPWLQNPLSWIKNSEDLWAHGPSALADREPHRDKGQGCVTSLGPGTLRWHNSVHIKRSCATSSYQQRFTWHGRTMLFHVSDLLATDTKRAEISSIIWSSQENAKSARTAKNSSCLFHVSTVKQASNKLWTSTKLETFDKASFRFAQI